MRRSPVRPDINVTPLVDVVLVLLIIFMVIAPQMEAGAHVELPTVANADPKTDARSAPVTISIVASGDYLLERERVGRERIVERLRDLHARAPDRPVVMKADRATPYRAVRALFKECQGLGFGGISMQVATAPAEAGR